MEFIEVNSSNLEKLGWDADEQVMTAFFHAHGKPQVGEISNVDEDDWQEFVDADACGGSVGKLYWSKIRRHPDLYPYKAYGKVQ